MSILIVTNTVLSILACIQIGRALVFVSITKNRVQSYGIPEFMYKDILDTEKARIVIIICILCKDLLLTTWNISRMINGFLTYQTGWITITSFIFHILMFLTAHFIFVFYKRPKDLTKHL